MSQSNIMTQEEEYLAIHQERYKVLLKAIANLQLVPNAKILDVGCFPPYIFNQLRSQGFEVHGIASYHESIKDKNIKIADIEKDTLPFQNNQFDVIIFTEVLEHMIATPKKYLSEFHRVLKKGGALVITTPNSVNLKNRIKLLFGKSVYFPLFQLYETTPDNGYMYHRHTREFTLEEVTEILSNAGFSITVAKQYSAYTPFRTERAKQQSKLEWIVKYLGYLITRLHPSLKDSLLVIAKK